MNTSFGNILLVAFLILFGATLLIAVAIPNWLIGLLAIAAGVMLLVGR